MVGAASDARLKTDIHPVTSLFPDIFKIINQLEGASFRLKSHPSDIHYGFIAQQIEKILPNLVKEDNNGYKSIDYNGLLPFIIESIKQLIQKLNFHTSQINELKQIVSQQQEEINLLKQEIQALKAR